MITFGDWTKNTKNREAKRQENTEDRRIRREADNQCLIARKRNDRWYFANHRNIMVSPERGLNYLDALQFLADREP